MNLSRRKLFTTAAGAAVAVAGGTALKAANRNVGYGSPQPAASAKPAKLTPQEIVDRDKKAHKEGIRRFLDSDSPWDYNGTRWVGSEQVSVLDEVLAERGLTRTHIEKQYWAVGDRVFIFGV